MKNIQLVKNFDLDGTDDQQRDKEVNEIFKGAFRSLIEVRLRNGGVLPKHKANEPITVLCLSGNGIFHAGSNLEDAQNLKAGTLITLEAGIEHEVIAEPALHLIVTKFKES